MSDESTYSALDQDSLAMHRAYPPGKVEVVPTKPLTTQYHLSLAYSPGVAAPCLEIEKDPAMAYEYTSKGNLVAVITDGSAVLGLGDIGALASKPVMEGKAVLFKRFADVDSVDIEVDTRDSEEFINCVKLLGPSWGGINLEDIKAPECFIIEQRLRELMDIPVFHDDQHGTAIIAAAGLINALHMTGRDRGNVKVVVNGAGASAIACVELIKGFGVAPENVIMCDSRGVIYQGREAGMNQWKSAHASPTPHRTLSEAVRGADVLFGLSVKGAFDHDMIRSMADNPIIFAMANPDPEITPEEVKAIRDDAIMATGRSDYPNQVNNVLGFPFIFRGALDVRASAINDEMKRAAAEALAELAREDVPDEVAAAYSGQQLRFGPDYIIPTPFDPRLITRVPIAVAKAAMETGVARKNITDWDAYERQLAKRLDPTAGRMDQVYVDIRANPRRVVFAEGEEERTIRAALAFRNQGLGVPVLIGREDVIAAAMRELGHETTLDLEIHNAGLSQDNARYMEYLYGRLQRHGYLQRDCQRMVNQDRNVFSACMVACGDADAMVTGLTRSFAACFEEVSRAISPATDSAVVGLTSVTTRDHTLVIADTLVHEVPSPQELADIAVQAAGGARRMGLEPRVAFLNFSNFGNPSMASSQRMAEAVELLDGRDVDFEYEGEMSADIALDHDLMKRVYPFARLSGPANVLVMPALHSANISAKLLQKMAGGAVLGPRLIGLEKPVQIVQMGAVVSEIINMAALAAHDSLS
jgi:malate dehydrogenase (oxaloacetate-decarboxylating)(NADP+)